MSSPDTPDLKEKITNEVGTGDWSLLASHAGRDALILIGAELHLVDVAVAIANDDADVVRGWLDSGLVFKPAQSHLERFGALPKTYFQFVVVSPFVVAKEIDLKHKTLH